MQNRFKRASNFILLIVPRRYFFGWFLFYEFNALLLASYAHVCFHIFSKVWVTEWPPFGKMAAHSAYNIFS